MFNTAKHFTQGVAVSHRSASIRATFLLAESPSALLRPLPWQALDAVLLGGGALNRALAGMGLLMCRLHV